MNINELMIGDFVYHETYGTAKVESIDNDFGEKPSVKLISENIKHKDGYQYGYVWAEMDEMFPIPLTPETLEKNEFVSKKGRVMQLGNFDNPPLILWHLVDDSILRHTKNQLEIHHGAENIHVSFMCHYVHELQHALKLCKIEKQIKL